MQVYFFKSSIPHHPIISLVNNTLSVLMLGLQKSDSQTNLITLQNSVFSEVSSAKELISDDEISDKTRLPANTLLPVWLASHCILTSQFSSQFRHRIL